MQAEKVFLFLLGMGGMKGGFGETGVFFEGKEGLVFGQGGHGSLVSLPGDFRQGLHPVKKCFHIAGHPLPKPGLEISLAPSNIGFRGPEKLINRRVFTGEEKRGPPGRISPTILTKKTDQEYLRVFSRPGTVMDRVPAIAFLAPQRRLPQLIKMLLIGFDAIDEPE